MMARVCNEPSCIAIVPVVGDGWCSIHRDMCAVCGHPRARHPVVQVGEHWAGAVVICDTYIDRKAIRR